MDEKLDKIQKSIDDLTAAVTQGFSNVEERMTTKAEMNAGFEGVNGKIDGVHRRIDAELERTLTIESRLVKVEKVVGLVK